MEQELNPTPPPLEEKPKQKGPSKVILSGALASLLTAFIISGVAYWQQKTLVEEMGASIDILSMQLLQNSERYVVSNESLEVEDDFLNNDSREYQGVISFNYPADWHISGSNDYDAPSGPLHIYRLSPNPIVTVSPNEGQNWTITMQSFTPGDAIFAPYEGVDWEAYEQDVITVQGKQVTRLRLTTPEEYVFSSRYQEILFVMGEVIGFEIVHSYSDPEEAENPDWILVRDSLLLK